MSQRAADDTIGGLVERTGLDQSTLSRNLRALEAERLVEIATVERDLRRRAVLLTESGARRLEAAIPLWRAAHGALAMRIDPSAAVRLAAKSEALKNA
jgi:DNA-binding MarR family transcriptional regulator